MKTGKNKLDVDVIGGLGELTIAEEKALNDYFKKQKIKANKKNVSKVSPKVAA